MQGDPANPDLNIRCLLREVRSCLVAVVDEVFFLEAETIEVRYHKLIKRITEASLIGKRSDVAVFICPFIHHIELDIAAVYLHFLKHICNLCICRARIAHNHNAKFVFTV